MISICEHVESLENLKAAQCGTLCRTHSFCFLISTSSSFPSGPSSTVLNVYSFNGDCFSLSHWPAKLFSSDWRFSNCCPAIKFTQALAEIFKCRFWESTGLNQGEVFRIQQGQICIKSAMGQKSSVEWPQ